MNEYKCDKCGFEFKADLNSSAFCPKCGSGSYIVKPSRDIIEKEVKRINKVMSGYRRVVAVSVKGTTKDMFCKEIRSATFVEAFAYNDIKNLISLRFDFADIFINSDHNDDDRKEIISVRCRSFGHDFFGGTVGENMVEIDAAESIKMSDEDIVRHVTRMFSDHEYHGHEEELAAELFDKMWSMFSADVNNVVSDFRKEFDFLDKH